MALTTKNTPAPGMTPNVQASPVTKPRGAKKQKRRWLPLAYLAAVLFGLVCGLCTSAWLWSAFVVPFTFLACVFFICWYGVLMFLTTTNNIAVYRRVGHIDDCVWGLLLFVPSIPAVLGLVTVDSFSHVLVWVMGSLLMISDLLFYIAMIWLCL